MAYGIMRIEKRKRSAVYGLQIEANRTKEDNDKGRDFPRSDIDWDSTVFNYHFQRTENWNNAITTRLKELNIKPRKDANVLLDGLYTASPEFFENMTRTEILQYFKDCLDFHAKTYGEVINAVIHFDETTPHMQVASIPLIEDEKGWHLSSDIIMGGRKDYRKRQDKFYEEVSSKYGLERGEIKEPTAMKAHTTKREWQIAKQKEEIERIKETKKELKKDIENLTEQRDSLEDNISIKQNQINLEIELMEAQVEEKKKNVRAEIKTLEGKELEIAEVQELQQKKFWSTDDKADVIKTALLSSENAQKAKKAIKANIDTLEENKALKKENNLLNNRLLEIDSLDRAIRDTEKSAKLEKEVKTLKKELSIRDDFISSLGLRERFLNYIEKMKQKFRSKNNTYDEI